MSKRADPFIRRGFTLIETLVSVTIFATIAVVLYSSFRSGVISWRRIDSQQAFQQRLRYGLGRITKDFKNMLYLSNITFEGDAAEVSFVTLVTMAGDADINVAKVTYYLGANDGVASTATLIRKEESLKDVINSQAEETATSQAAQGGVGLIDNVSELKFSYLSAPEGIEKTKEAECEWQDKWEAQDKLPLGIKIELTLINPDNYQPVKLSKRIWIPISKKD